MYDWASMKCVADCSQIFSLFFNDECLGKIARADLGFEVVSGEGQHNFRVQLARTQIYIPRPMSPEWSIMAFRPQPVKSVEKSYLT